MFVLKRKAGLRCRFRSRGVRGGPQRRGGAAGVSRAVRAFLPWRRAVPSAERARRSSPSPPRLPAPPRPPRENRASVSMLRPAVLPRRGWRSGFVSHEDTKGRRGRARALDPEGSSQLRHVAAGWEPPSAEQSKSLRAFVPSCETIRTVRRRGVWRPRGRRGSVRRRSARQSRPALAASSTRTA